MTSPPPPPGPQADRARRAGRVAAALWAVGVAVLGGAWVWAAAPGGAGLALGLAVLAAALAVPGGLMIALGEVAALALAAQAPPAAARAPADQAPRLQTLERRLQDLEAAQRARAAAAQPGRAPVPGAGAPGAEPAPAPAAPAPQAAPEQGSLPLQGGADGAAALTQTDVVRALNFPHDARDHEGFDILARAMATPEMGRLLQSAEDCLTLLSQAGLYMDDLMPAPATAADWRNFAEGGAKRQALMPLNGIRDEAAIETVRERMRADPIFRDAALHFQRRFDRLLQRLAPELPDALLLDLVDTRSGRAYVLLVQVGGSRDPAPA